METKKTFVTDFAASVLFSFLGSLFIGYLFFQEKIFSPYLWVFQFVVFGMIGALFLVYIYKKLSKHMLFFLLIVFIHTIIFEKTFLFWFIIRDVFFIFSLFLSVNLYLIFIEKYKSLVLFLRAFGFSVIYAVINLLVGSLLIILHNIFSGFVYGNSWRGIFIYAQCGALIGLGLGLGFDLWEIIKKKDNEIKSLINKIFFS